MPQPTPVLLDVSRLIWRAWRGQLPTGIDRACLAYVRHYGDRALAVVQRGGVTRVLDRRASAALFALLTARPASYRRDVVRLLAPLFLFGAGAFRGSLRSLVYLNVGHTGLDRAGHERWVARTGVRAVYYVHDLIPITHPAFVREGEPDKHRARMAAVLRRGAAVLGNSDDSLTELRTFARGIGQPMPPALCVPLGVEVGFSGAPGGNPLAGQAYFVTLGTIEGRKNHALLLAVWRRLIAQEGAAAPKLVIIGRRGWAADAVFRALDDEPGLRPAVVELGACDDRALQAYLAHARALLFPSFAEGQGLPLIEALVAGTPVIASDLGVFHEIAGEIPDYRAPDDEDGWLAAVQDYARPESAARRAQRERLAGFSPVTWAEHFAQVDAWIDAGFPQR